MRLFVVLCALAAGAGCSGRVDRLREAFPAARQIVLDAPASDGAIKTCYTFARNPANPRHQVDVWHPAILLAILDPAAEAAGLGAWAARERAYLRDQIETNGLVRYHGRKSTIVPDVDDTALVWLTAAPDDPALARQVIAAMQAFRTPEGFYRTWMNEGGIPGHPNEGLDPNPADFGINIHLYLFFSRYAPEAARELCEVLRAHVQDRRFYPYGRLAIPFYYLREIAVRASGCDLPTAESVFDTSTPGQAVYTEASRLIRDLALGPRPPRADVLRVLETLSQDNFRHAREAPALIYHADLTAPQARYYWSTEVAAALWMRLYAEASHHYRRWPAPPP